MMLLKWIGGIVLAGILALGSANLVMHHTGKFDMNNLTTFQYWIIFLAVPSIGFGLFVFLACTFVPVQKKYAGLVVLVLCLLLIGMGAYQHYIDNGYLPRQYVIRYTGITMGLAGGYLTSFRVYTTNRWNAVAK
jgi:hypothetical protein